MSGGRTRRARRTRATRTRREHKRRSRTRMTRTRRREKDNEVSKVRALSVLEETARLSLAWELKERERERSLWSFP